MSRNIFRPGGTAVRWLGIAWRFPSSLQDKSFSAVVLQPLRSWLISSVAPRLQSRRPKMRALLALGNGHRPEYRASDPLRPLRRGGVAVQAVTERGSVSRRTPSFLEAILLPKPLGLTKPLRVADPRSVTTAFPAHRCDGCFRLSSVSSASLQPAAARLVV